VKQEQVQNTLAIQRLTALWALTESGLGGILHAFKSPFTGLIVGSIAMCLIVMICHYSDSIWKTVSKALIIVLIVKMMVSPHAMISAYVAVSFQAVLGAGLMSLFGIKLWSIMALGCLGLVESALQKLIILTLLYGKSIWEAINELGEWIAKKLGFLLPFESAELLIASYVGLYFFVGLWVGYMIYKLRNKVANADIEKYNVAVAKLQDKMTTKKRKRRKYTMIGMILFLALLIVLVLKWTGAERGWSLASYLLIRTVLILGLWYGILAPIIMKRVKLFLSERKGALSKEVDEVFELLPYMRQIVSLSWNETKGGHFIIRIKDFIFHSLMYSLHFKSPRQ